MISREWEDFFFFKHVPSSRWIMLLIILFREKLHNFGLIREKLAWTALQQDVTEVRITPFLRILRLSYELGQTTTWTGRFLSSNVSRPEVFFRKLFLLLYLETDWGKQGWKRRSIRESLEMFRGKVIKAWTSSSKGKERRDLKILWQ